jgi:DNA-binding PadR family transcriptional regulator
MNEAELTILSLLAETPRYDFEIQKLIDDRGLRAWVPIGFSSLYYLLDKLERQALIAAELRPGSQAAPRKYYSLTDAGRGVIQTAIADLLRQPRSIGSGFELGLANLHILKPAQVYQTLSHHLADLKRRLTSAESAWEVHQRDNPDTTDNISALYTHSIAVMQAEVVWLTDFIAAWSTRYPAASSRTGGSGNGDDTGINHNTPDPARMIQQLRRPLQPPTEG